MSCEICGQEHSTKSHNDGVEKSVAFLAVITRYYIREHWHLKECELAQALRKPMIAAVEKGVDWSEYKRFPWIKVMEFDRENLDMQKIEKELGPILRGLSRKTS